VDRLGRIVYACSSRVIAVDKQGRMLWSFQDATSESLGDFCRAFSHIRALQQHP
jgi:hypothetical protein